MLPEALAANALIESFLVQQRDLFSVDAKSYCFMHRRQCPVHLEQALKNMTSGSSSACAAGSSCDQQFLENQFLGEAQSTQMYLGMRSSFRKLSRVKILEMLLCAAYQDWSVPKVHLDAVSQSQDICSRPRIGGFLAKQCLEDRFFSENSSAYPVQSKQVDALEATHSVMHIRICPTQLGFPMKRPRMFFQSIEPVGRSGAEPL